MANASVGAVRIIDSDGDVVESDGSGRLKVSIDDIQVADINVHLEASTDDVLIYGYDYSSANQKLLVDSVGHITVKQHSDSRTVNVISGFATQTTLSEIEGYFKAPGNSYSAGGVPQGLISLAFRQDTIGSYFSGIGVSDDDWVYLSVNSKGGLYVTGSEVENASVQSEPLLIGGRFDTSARTLGDGDAGAVALAADGAIHIDDGGNVISVDVASGGIASGAVASGAFASGSIASGAVASGAIASGAAVDGSIVTLGAKTDAANANTDSTSITAMQVLKQISASVQETATDTGNMDTDTGNIAGAIGTHNDPAGATGMMLMGESRVVDAAAFPPVSGEGDSTNLQCSLYGVPFTNLVTENGSHSAVILDGITQIAVPAMVNVGAEYRNSNTTYANGDATILQSDINGAIKTTHNITGLASDDNDTVGTSAEKISGVDGDVACKRVDIMAHPDNTGEIWIGDGAVTTNGANGGIRLLAGDFYSMDIDNTGDVYAVATVDGENVCFNYFT